MKLFLIPLAMAIASPEVNSDWGRVVGHCKTKSPAHHVWIFKQWHLSPKEITKDRHYLVPLPQEKNQTAIYRQLDSWIEKKRIQEIYAEGCSGEVGTASASEIDLNSKLEFNGWTVSELAKVKGESYFPEVITNVPLKLEAKYGKALQTLCGDSLPLLKENELAFSDARGTLGFLKRLMQYQKDPVRVKNYLEGAIELYKLPQNSTVAQVTERLQLELGLAVKRAKESIEKRNEHLVELLKKSKQQDVAVVFGGMHATGLVRLLEKAGMGCSIVEPVGYQDVANWNF